MESKKETEEMSSILDDLLEDQTEEVEEVNKTSRFSEATWLSEVQNYQGFIGGVGNIGSWLALFLGRIDLRLILIDPDKIEIQNVGGQLYSSLDVGSFKVIALSKILNYLDASTHNTFSVKDFLDSNVINQFSFSQKNILYL